MPITRCIFGDLITFADNIKEKEMTAERISILVVEDEQHIRRVLEYNLKLDGFEVYLAEDGATGLRLAREKKPDVILLDWLMPEMNGIEVLTELKRDSSTAPIPILMLTAKGMLSDVTKAFERGIDDYITKPFDPMQLGKTIRDKLEKYAKAKVG
jgi:DNA-binding response OmpR family regulator